MHSILILDANERSALAATRSLGKKGIPVIVADEKERTLSSVSKYSKGSFAYPSPYDSPDLFVDCLEREVKKRNIRIIFPMTDVTTYLLLKNRERFSPVILPFGSFEAFEALSDKWNLLKLAKSLNIPFPQTYFINHFEEVKKIASLCSYPVVIKPFRSRILQNGKWLKASVRYANTPEELVEIVKQEKIFRDHKFLVQHHIKGEGQGVFVLCKEGKPFVFFAHRRLREKPPSGGVSTLRESIALDPRMKRYAEDLLSHVDWHGVAMVEFRVTHDGTPYLMEINARFWGSLQLAIDAGVDFPYLLYHLALNDEMPPVNSYKVGIRSRWLLGDLDRFCLRFKEQKLTLNFFRFFNTNSRHEVFRIDDLKPFFFELKEYLGLKR